MYESFYRFREKPFTLLPDPGFLYLGKRHSMALAMLQYGLSSQAGFTVIAGEIGSGKTTLIRHLLDHMDRDVTVGLITNTHSSFGELLEWVLLAFGLEYKHKDKVERFHVFTDFIISEYAHKRRTVLIIDEAQNLKPETLEELRMLSNINADKNQVLQLILVGQPELRQTLRRPDLKQFAQRVSVAYYLAALNAEETADYVRHRLRTAGGDPDLFTPEALALVHQYSEGVPRVINNLCDTALVYGFAEQAAVISGDILRDVLRDKADGGLFDLPSPDEETGEEPSRSSDGAAAAARPVGVDPDRSLEDTQKGRRLLG